MQLSEKQKSFSEVFAAFLKSILNFEILKNKLTLRDFVFSKLRIDSENVVRSTSKKSCFRGPLDKQHGKRAQAQFRSGSHQLYRIHLSLGKKLSWKKSLLLTCQILGLLVNTLAADEKDLVLHRDNLTIPIKMQLCQKEKLSFFFFCSNFEV